MYRSISIKNFRGHASLELDFLGEVNLLTGLNDAGKTSVLEALFLHASGPLAGVNAMQALRLGRGQADVAFGFGSDSPWANLFHNFDMSRPVVLAAQTARGRSSVSLSKPVANVGDAFAQTGPAGTTNTAAANLDVTVTVGSGEPKIYHQMMTVRETEQGQNRSVNVELKVEPGAPGPLINAHILKPGRIMNDLAAGFSDMRKHRVAPLLLEALQDLDPRIASLEILVTNGRPVLHAQVGEILIPFDLLGDGPNTVAQYLVAVAAAREGTLLLDEVGSGVHHTVLHAMWRTIFRTAKKMSVQVFATTHSQETVIAAQDVIKENNALVVHRLRRSDREHDGVTHVTSYYGAKLKSALEVNADLR